MIIVIDFDGVLFNDRRFKDAYESVFAQFGVSKAAYSRAYNDSKRKSGGCYEPKFHLGALKKENPDLPWGEIGRAIDGLTARAFSFIYADAKPFLAFFKEKGASLFLLSTGDAVFQRKKVNKSGVVPFFKNVMLTKNASKRVLFGKIIRLAKDDRVIFLDDKKEVVDEIKKEFPNARVIQVIRRKDQPGSVRADARAKRLSGVKRILLKNQ